EALDSGGRFVGEFGAMGNVSCIIDALASAVSKLGIDAAGRNPWYFPTAGQYAALLEEQGFGVRKLVTFDRPTDLADGENGLKHWLDMFCGVFTQGLSSEQMQEVYEDIYGQTRAKLWINGTWKADYVRLRFVAQKQ